MLKMQKRRKVKRFIYVIEDEKDQPKIERKSKEEWAKIVKEENETLLEEYKKQGDMVYELYAILIHDGGAHAGHYYAYIKDFSDGQWYKFNDVMVYKISFLEIISTFGQKQTKKRKFGHYRENRANAYMLMYRHIDPAFNINNVPSSMISQQVKDEISQDLITEKEKLRERERKDNQMQIKVMYNDESVAFWVNKKEDQLSYLLSLAMKEFKLDHLDAKN